MKRLFFVTLGAAAIANGYLALLHFLEAEWGWGLFSAFFCIFSLNALFNILEERYY